MCVEEGLLLFGAVSAGAPRWRHVEVQILLLCFHCSAQLQLCCSACASNVCLVSRPFTNRSLPPPPRAYRCQKGAQRVRSVLDTYWPDDQDEPAKTLDGLHICPGTDFKVGWLAGWAAGSADSAGQGMQGTVRWPHTVRCLYDASNHNWPPPPARAGVEQLPRLHA